MNNPWFFVENAHAIDSPALLVYPDRVAQNIQTALQLSGDAVRLRPHVKTHKIREVTELLLAAGIQQFKCATIAEAEMLALANAPDVLLAYPPVGPKAARFAALTQAFPNVKFSCLIDNFQAAQHLAQAFDGRAVDVYLDLNVGMNRTGVLPADALTLVAACQMLPNLNVVGLHAYDGHIHDTDLERRRQRADAAYTLAKTAQQVIQENFGKTLPLVIGGTPTFVIHARREYPEPASVQVSPGTFVFWDAGYAQTLPDLPFDWAAVLLTRVISILDEQTLCLDLGHKSVAAENPLPRVQFLNAPDAEQLRQSEEHLVVRVADTRQHQVGEVWYAVPMHVCPTVALYEAVFVVENGVFTKKWNVIARNRQLQF
ncbi:MAG: D-TA family PLP-dependent enzyme [Cytophagaceae bacterium]|nr:D-TA family PLP-dependent enzyme [Cytophagaceae bacterium]